MIWGVKMFKYADHWENIISWIWTRKGIVAVPQAAIDGHSASAKSFFRLKRWRGLAFGNGKHLTFAHLSQPDVCCVCGSPKRGCARRPALKAFSPGRNPWKRERLPWQEGRSQSCCMLSWHVHNLLSLQHAFPCFQEVSEEAFACFREEWEGSSDCPSHESPAAISTLHLTVWGGPCPGALAESTYWGVRVSSETKNWK